MGSSATFDFVAGFFTVVGTSLSEKTKAVLLNLSGISTDEDPDKGEIAKQVPMFQPLGMLVRPLEPDTGPDGKDRRAGGPALRTADSVIPLVWKDPRIDAAFPDGMNKGTIALAGYGGGFHSIGLTADGSNGPPGGKGANVHVIYAPYAYSGGSPTKALAAILDPTAGKEAITLVHGDGYFLQMQTGKGIRGSVDGSTFFQIKPDLFQVQAKNIKLQGNVAIGANTDTAIPFAGGPAMLPSPSVWLSIV